MQYIWIFPIMVLFLILYMLRKKRKIIYIKKLIKNRNTEEKREMIELAKRFIEKDCLIYGYEGHQYIGVIKEVTNGAILLEKDGQLEAINLDFVTRIREYPKDKKGKKKSVVLD